MARKRPIASNVVQPDLILLDGGRADADAPLLTRAEAASLRRSAPLTHLQLRAHLKGTQAPPLRGA